MGMCSQVQLIISRADPDLHKRALASLNKLLGARQGVEKTGMAGQKRKAVGQGPSAVNISVGAGSWQLKAHMTGMKDCKRPDSASALVPKRLRKSGSESLQRAGPKPLQPGINDLGRQTEIQYHPRALKGGHVELFKALKVEVPWLQQEIWVMGRSVLQPRLVAYMADHERLSYTYSKTKQTALPWSPSVSRIKEELERLTGAEFNSCLLNFYEGGKHSLAWHSDNEKVYGTQPTIASVSLGEARDFILRNNADHAEKYAASLGGGDVLVMSGNCQRDWQHAVPKRASLTSGRISLTFRKIIELESV